MSDLAIPGTAPCADEQPRDPIRITARRGALSGQSFYRVGAGFLHFASPGIADYRIAPDAIEVTAPDPLNADVIGLLIATALPGLLWMRGRFVLHAAGLALGGDDAVVALAGPSGVGKSTTAALLISNGARLVGDDTLAIDIDDNVVQASGLSGGYFLGSHPDRRFHTLPPSSQLAAGRLAGVIVLDPQLPVDATPVLEPINAVQALLRHRHRPKIPDLLGARGRVMQQAVEIVRQLPVMAWNPRVEAPCRPDELGVWLSGRLRGAKEN